MTAAPRKLLVMELAGLGDNVHLLPALWWLRRRWPEAELHVMASAHGAGLFKLTPWVQRVWAYPRQPRPGLSTNIRWAGELRRERFDLVVNTTGSDRSSLLSWATRAPVRVGRLPADGGPIGWRHLFTQVLESPYFDELMYWQKWRCVRQISLPGADDLPSGPEFHVSIDAGLRRAAGIAAGDDGGYLHMSPFTSADAKELPLPQLAELIGRLHSEFPAYRLALSCAGTPRETGKLDALLGLLRQPPWKVFAGTLDVAQFTAVVQGAALNLSGDTASLHLAMLTATPAVAWYRAHRGLREWIPDGPGYRVLVNESPAADALRGVDTDALVDAAAEVLASAAGRPPHAP